MLREILRAIRRKMKREARPVPAIVATGSTLIFPTPAGAHAAREFKVACPNCRQPILCPDLDDLRIGTVGPCSECGYILRSQGAEVRPAGDREVTILRRVNPEVFEEAERLQREWRARVLPIERSAEIGGRR